MKRSDKKEIRERVISIYKMMMPTLYKAYGSKYTSNEIRLEVLKATQGHIMGKTTTALSKKVKRKKVIKSLKCPQKLQEGAQETLTCKTPKTTGIDISNILK